VARDAVATRRGFGSPQATSQKQEVAHPAVMILIIILGYMVDGLIFRTMERRLQEKYGLTPA
jgi:predicted transcriptional regulator